LIAATARRPAGWDVFSMGAGILDARALLEADLDAGRDREAAPQPDTAEARDTIAMRSFVLETAGVDASRAPLDWQRFGPEIATAVLRSRLQGRRPAAAGLVLEETVAAPSLSPRLTAALARSPVLRESLGVPAEPGDG
jgi:hypothetical protein